MVDRRGRCPGANSTFYGRKLLTAENAEAEADLALIRDLGLVPMAPNPALEAPAADPALPRGPAVARLEVPA